MDISIGGSVLMESSGALDRIKCHMVGYVKDEYVLLRVPLVPGIRSRVPEGASLTFRYLRHGKLVSFRSVVKNYIATPYSLLFVTYPNRLDFHELRNEKRYTCNFPALIQAFSQEYSGLLLDLSPGGCRFFFDDKNVEPPGNLRIDLWLRGTFRPPNTEPIPFRGQIVSLAGYSRTRTVNLRFAPDQAPLTSELREYMSETQEMLDRMHALDTDYCAG
ncbi:PilZ domain-containing protein [Paucidesulfovibrio gracilis DSM 16080]|uniref:PilZ domain-containing protein n=1 Tax=Paucidesulfovibrio gracilis DSM 16080 TaxID=1121449 RepID=A0A1T4WKN8_9BACT|nr:flagellar brake protein [Paucidesulfovibrio gracilis]SKA77727.1 PilZ domain-containing protein [Paucidesulfovibrio gracilis DSM 16080]